MTGSLQHLMIIACYYKAKHFSTGKPVKIADECVVANGFYWAFHFLPYWWRFAQCINKYHETELTNHLINAGKYFSCLVSPTVLYFLTASESKTGLKY